MLALAKEAGLELSGVQLKAVSGGSDWSVEDDGIKYCINKGDKPCEF